jgi:hypothetical protein
MRRLRALGLFVLGYASLTLLGPLVAAPLALVLFYLGGLAILAEPAPDDPVARIAHELARFR